MTHATNPQTAFSLSSLMSEMHTDVAKVGYRGLTNSLNTRAIYTMDRHLSIQKRKTQEALNKVETHPGFTELDAANELINTEGAMAEEMDKIRQVLGFKPERNLLAEAIQLRKAANWLSDETKTLSDKMFDQPMTLHQSLELALRNTPRPGADQLRKTVAEIMEIDESMLKMASDTRREQDRLRLLDNSPEILSTLEAVDEGYESAFDDLPVITRFRLFEKLVAVLENGMMQTYLRMEQRRNFSELSLLQLFKSEIKRVKEFVKQFETAHKDELLEAMNLS